MICFKPDLDYDTKIQECVEKNTLDANAMKLHS